MAKSLISPEFALEGVRLESMDMIISSAPQI